MKTATAGLALACALLLPTTLAWSQTIDEVIERSITAQGGRAALAKLKSRSTTGTIVFATPGGELSGTIEVLNAAPNKIRTLVKADLSAVGAGQLVIDQRFDGSSGYVLDTMQGNREITGDQLLNLKNGSFPHPFLNYKDMGTTAELLGKEKVGDREAFVVNFDPATGSAVKEYIDAETYLPIKVIVRMNIPQFGGELEQTNEFSDYRNVDGIKLPFKLRSTSSVQNFNVTITKVEHNGTVDQSLFSKPAEK
jgi:zinc protease